MNTPAPASTPATAETVAVSLAVLHAHLVRLHGDAEAARLPQGVVMGLHWLAEDAASTLAHLHGMMAPEAISTAAKP